MKRGHRFLAGSIGAVGLVAAAGRALSRRTPGAGDDPGLGSLRGEVVTLRGPRASQIYAERFPGTKGTIVLTHGWCLNEAVWHYQKAALSEAGFTVIAWDLPGHGASTPVARGHLTLELAVDALARVIRRFEDPLGTVLVGHSLGGILTLAHLAGRTDARLEGIKGAVFVSTPLMHFARSIAGRWPGAGLEARALGSMMELVVGHPALDRVFSGGVGEAKSAPLSYRVVRVGFGKDPSPAHVRFVRDIIATVTPQSRVDTFRAMTGYDLSGALGSVTVPSLVVVGGRDRLVNPAETKLIGQRVPRARTVVFPDAGHASFLERSDEFNAELIAFAEARLRPRRPRRPPAARKSSGAAHARRSSAASRPAPSAR
jgi:pimeloyl-ACP methyl ester carboxylesterase